MNDVCVIRKTNEVIAKRWTLLILLELYKGESEWKRFSELKKRLSGVTSKILSQRLKELEVEGFICKRIQGEKYPLKSEYRLSMSGKDFIKIIKDIKKWALNWKSKGSECNKTDCFKCEF